MIKMTIDFLSLTVLSEQSSQYTLPAHPKDFGGHSAFGSTSAFTGSGVVAFAFGFEVKSGSRSGVNFLFPFDDVSILDKFANEDSGVGLSDLLEFIWIHPYSFFPAFQDLRSDTFLTL